MAIVAPSNRTLHLLLFQIHLRDKNTPNTKNTYIFTLSLRSIVLQNLTRARVQR